MHTHHDQNDRHGETAQVGVFAAQPGSITHGTELPLAMGSDGSGPDEPKRRVQVYLDEVLAAQLHLHVRTHGVKHSEVGRRAIKIYLAMQEGKRNGVTADLEARVAATLNASTERYRELLNEAVAQILERLTRQ